MHFQHRAGITGASAAGSDWFLFIGAASHPDPAFDCVDSKRKFIGINAWRKNRAMISCS